MGVEVVNASGKRNQLLANYCNHKHDAIVGKKMVLTVKPAAQGDYYFQRSDLEVSKRWADGLWFCPSNRLGVKHRSAVDINQLEMLLNRQRPDTGERRDYVRLDKPAARDFVFSAPKSVSLLWAFGSSQTRECVEQAQSAAVWRSMELLFESAMFERCGAGGKNLRPADGAAALFNHVATRFAVHENGSRFPDPNLHTHAVVPDLVANENGKLKVAYTTVWGRWAMTLGAWYHAHLAHRLRNGGFTITSRGENGVFQIEGVKPDWISAFSARTEGAKLRRRIVGSTGFRGTTTTQDFLSTKSRYETITADELRSLWVAQKKLHNLDVTLIEAAASQAKQSRTVGNIDVVSTPSQDTLDAVLAEALRDLSERSSIMQLSDIVRSVASFLVRSTLSPPNGLPDIRRAISANNDLMELEKTPSYGFEQWTTRTAYSLERSILKMTMRLVSKRFVAVDVERFLHPSLQAMNDDQIGAARLIVSAESMVLIEGVAGTGKTSLLGPAIEAFKAPPFNLRVIGCAEAWLPALALRERFGIECHALADLFVRIRAAGEGNVKSVVDSQTVLIVDEVGLLSSRRMHELLKIVSHTGAKLVLVGDEDQLDPINAGSGLRLIKRNPDLKIASLTRLVRQDDENQRQAIQSLVDGHVDRFCDLMSADSRWQTMSSYNDAYAYIVDELRRGFGDRGGEGADLVAVVRSNREVHDVSRKLRTRLRTDGVLTGPDVEFHAVTPMGASVRLKLAKGDHIRFLTRNADLGVFNGTRGVIEKIDCDPAGTPMCIVAQIHDRSRPSQNSVSFAPNQMFDPDGRLRIAPAYASTVYGLQGATVDETIIFKTSALTYRELYVAATRARRHCQIIDVSSAAAAALSSDKRRKYALESRTQNLSGMKRRKKSKPLALDFMPPSLISTIVDESIPSSRNGQTP